MSDTTLAVKTIKNSIINITSFLVSLLINFFLLRFTVAHIGVAAYGISAILTVVIMPLNLTNLGFGEATTKYVAEYIHLGEREKAGTYIRTTFFMNLMVGLFGLVLTYFFGGKLVMSIFSENIPADQTDAVYTSMKLIAFGWLFNQCSTTFLGIPVALQQFSKVAIGNLILIISTAVFTYLFLMQDLGLVGFILATVTAQFISLCYWIYIAKKSIPDISIRPAIDKTAWSNSFHYGGWQTLAQVGGMLSQMAERYIMGILLAVASVGVYNVVLKIEQNIYNMVHKLSEVLFPMFSAISNDTTDRKANILIKSTWITTSIAVTLLVSVIPFAHPLILLWMKNADVANQGKEVLQVLCLGGAFGSATTAGYFFLLGIGKTQKLTYISLLTGIVTLITALIVLPIYGLKGAGWSALIAAMVQSLAIIRVMHTALKEVITLSAIVTAVFAPIITGIVLSLLVTAFVHVSLTNWFSLGIAYGLMFLMTSSGIYLVTRILPHGKEHEALLKKLFEHLLQRLKMNKA